ncbi:MULTISPECIES: phosphatase PAP2 family protein [unclassified Streptomyces]|uniref:phosphatase PAP2 family protein n=1 Tax=unclassified Streptomyces TaxID=2593676 RepID=UPI00202FFB00|nr:MULTISPECIES: phosphatase PAP2 family protein [unclassified Streptomyces]MCM1967642.1 phosphatase PAP2 family protein [Streptomyces sp. G1]MCX5125929.1 phosphatase PAP2 family protein [Streptomyces sp. NBC_00347]MCX5298264.1 phosphatase PAP2 family protein [Streptomyces sp. NBC_00193]
MTNRRQPPRWWAELLLLGLVYAAYSGGRLLARGDVGLAVDHGLAILRTEELLALDLERPLNRLFTGQAVLGIPADFVYASLHYLVTPAVLVWLYRRRPQQYRFARTWLMVSTLLGLVGFALVPTCPPRLLDASYGFTDTMAHYSAYGWWGGEASAPRGLGSFTNQFAAMPSLHVGWALWCGIVLWSCARRPLVRALGAAYPAVTTVVVMGTANHYFLDAVAGAAVMGAGYLAARALPAGITGIARAAGAGLPASGGSAEPAPHTTRTAGFRGKSTIVSGGWETSAGELLPVQRSAVADPAAVPRTDGAAGGMAGRASRAADESPESPESPENTAATAR